MQEYLVNIYNSLDIFVFPTYRKSESLGLVGLEAMACETLVIASNNYGPTDYIKDKKTLIPYIQCENPIEMDRIRVGVFTNDPFENLAPCPYIRLHALFSELSKTKKYTL